MADNIAASILSGVQLGRENKRQRTLADYLQPAIGGDQTALGQLFKVDPDAGLMAQRYSGQQAAAGKQSQIEELKQAAGLWQSAPPQVKQALYSRIRTLTAAVGLAPEDKLPVSLDSPELEQGFGRFISSLAGNGEAEQFTLAPGSRRFDASGRVVAEAPFAPANLQTLPTDQGYATFDPRTGSTAPLTYGGAPSDTPDLPSAPGVDMSRVQRAMAMLAGRGGVQMTSGTRTPEHNAEVGGKPNSQHLRGTAGDYVVPADQKAAFIAEAQQNGLHAIDEGDHIHVQAQRQGGGSNRVQAPAKATAQSDIERRVAIAQSMGASDEDIRRMVVGAPANKPTAAGSASAKVPQLNAVDRGIDRIDEALKGLEGNKYAGTGPVDRFVTGYTDKGRELEAAVNSIQNQLLTLTRVPGMGSQSDFEARIAAMQYPSLNMPESVNRKTLQNLRLFVNDLRKQVEGASPGSGQTQAPAELSLPPGFTLEN